MNSFIHKSVVAGVIALAASTSHAASWEWSFFNDKGTFVNRGIDASGATRLSTNDGFPVSASTTSVLTGSRSASQHLPYINGVGLAGTFAWNDFSATAWRYADHGNYVVYRQNSLDGAGYKFIHRQTESAGLRDFIDDRSAQATGGLRQLAVTAVPEPETIALMFAGLGAIAFMARRCG